MLRFFLSLPFLVIVISSANGAPVDSVTARQLQALDPEERQEQRCDLEAMSRIAKSDPHASPDKVIAYAFGDTKRDHDMLKAPGAVFRGKGNWYHLKYRCATTPDGLDVTSFMFVIGNVIDRSEWQSHYLYD